MDIGLRMRWSQVRNRWRLLSGYLAGQASVSGYPITLIVENTGKCNLKCPMCPREFVPQTPEDLDFELFKSIIDQAYTHTELVFPWGGGEPLLNPDLPRMVRYCRDAGIYTVVSTNATVLDEARSLDLIEAGLDHLIIAFDGATPEVYEKYRKGARFDKVRSNVLRFLELKKRLSADVFVVVQMVRLPDNRHQIREFRRLWSVEGVDEVRIKEDETVIKGVALEERANHNRRRRPCYQLWQGPPAITYRGDFFPCCYTWWSAPFGDAKTTSLYDLWNSDAMRRIREAHLRGDLSDYPDCRNCHAPNPRLPVIVGTFLVDTYRIRRWIPRVERLAAFYRLPVFRDR
jgi:MoaA/NifB/PqqE/SkfB family radical SAM enzyme